MRLARYVPQLRSAVHLVRREHRSMRARRVHPTAATLRRVFASPPQRPPFVCTSCQVPSTRNRYFATQPAPAKPYYITTPIFYVNAAPHVGHLYTMVLTDIIKRWQVLKGRQAILLTGTDEHGLKVRTAKHGLGDGR
jgi:methionyl-tRNA synthetase